MIKMVKLMLGVFYHSKKIHTLESGVQTSSVKKAVDSVSKDTAC